MNFVSLVSTDNKIYGRIEKDVFEDIKLTQLFSDNVISVMQQLPVREDIVLRQGVFKALDEEKTVEFFSLLLSKLRRLRDIFTVYLGTSSEKEKQYLFCALMHYFCDFCTEASVRVRDEGLIADFCKSFADIVSEAGFDNMKEETDKLYSRFFGEFGILIAEDKLVLSSKPKEGYIEIIRRCAGDMNIALRDCDYMPRRVSKETVETLSVLYPELWSDLASFYTKYSDYPKKEILKYIDQLDFYLSVHSLKKRICVLGIPTCYASLTDKQRIRIMTAHDITLITKECDNIIPNDVIFDTDDPFFFLSGANGGGKTTYLRTCGVNVIFALLGCPVPAVSAELCMLNTVAAHFPRDERFDTDGRFLDEQRRVDELVLSLGTRSLVLLNETYSTTNETKAAEMTVMLANKLYSDKQFGVYVTHQKSVTKESIPLLCCRVDENDENKRTYKIERIDNIGISHAEDILKKYSLSFKDLTERFGDLG